jgi:hypothetical protein
MHSHGHFSPHGINYRADAILLYVLLQSGDLSGFDGSNALRYMSKHHFSVVGRD